MTAEREQRAMNRLRAGAGAYACGGFLAGQSALQRSEICTSLLFDRLERKMRMVEALRHEAAENWNQTFYLLYFRTLGDRQNQEAYLTLARRVSYKTVLRERLAPHAVESLLFGASGLLALYPHDTYTLNLARNFEYLAAKYDIEPLDAGVWELDAWQLGDIRPANHPVLRLAQAAEFFAQDEFVMERAMACRTEEEIRRLFCVEASDYWRTHHIPGIAGDDRPKRLGAFKANIIGINLVSVLQFAYGSYTGREALRDSALTLLERLPAEDNRYMRGWHDAGLTPRSAFESQALLQLATEYCAAKRCAECPVGRRILNNLKIGKTNSTAMQKQTPLISVIMPLYNAERFVGESIENVLRQTVGDFELIVIDDASTDASAEIARAYAAKDDRIVLMHNELNSGAARTRNRALDAARGKFITFMDADDLCSPERFAKQLAFFERHPQTDICGSYYTMFGTRGGVMAN